MSVGMSLRVVILLYSFLVERMASACDGTLGGGLGHVTVAVGRDASTKEILQGYSVKTKYFVEKTKCLVVFSKCFVIFSKYYLVFHPCRSLSNKQIEVLRDTGRFPDFPLAYGAPALYTHSSRARIYVFIKAVFCCKLFTRLVCS